MLSFLKLLSPSTWGLLLLSLLATFGSGLWVGAEWELGRVVKKEVKQKELTIAKADKQVEQDVKATKKAAAVRTQTKIEVQTVKEKVYEEVTKIVYDPSCRISDDGLSDINRLISKTITPRRGDDPMPPINEASGFFH